MPQEHTSLTTSPVPALSPGEVVAIWSKAVDTQMHFNEMSVKSRQLGLTFVAAALGVAVVMIGQGKDYSLHLQVHTFGFRLHVAVLLVAAAVLAVLAVRRLDLGVYHRMLRGAVTFGEDLEGTRLAKMLELNKGMTQAISHYSRYSDAAIEAQTSASYIYRGTTKKSAEQKIRGFYAMVLWFLGISVLGLFVVTNLETEPAPPTAKGATVEVVGDSSTTGD